MDKLIPPQELGHTAVDAGGMFPGPPEMLRTAENQDVRNNRALQARANQSPQVRQLKALQLSVSGNQSPIQCRTIGTELAAANFPAERYNFIEFGDLLNNGNTADSLQARNVPQQADMHSALKLAVDRFEEVGQIAYAVNRNAPGGAVPAHPGQQLGGQIINANLLQRHPNDLEPFVFQITVPFLQAGVQRKLSLWYQYAINQPGYVIRQNLDGEPVASISQNPNVNQAPGLADSYFSTHANTGATPLLGNVHQNPAQPESTNSEALDARTKLAGEGARFNVVKNHMGNIADDSKIYIKRRHGGGQNKARWVTFRSLWMNWARVFNSAYGITDDELCNAILHNPNWHPDAQPAQGPVPTSGIDILLKEVDTF